MSRHRRITAAIVSGLLLMGLGASSVAAGARAPRVAITAVCSSTVTYSDPSTAPGVQVLVFDAGGTLLRTSAWLYCPSGGGRVRAGVVGLIAEPTSVIVRCWNGFVATDISGELRFRTTCHDATGSYGAYADVTVHR